MTFSQIVSVPILRQYDDRLSQLTQKAGIKYRSHMRSAPLALRDRVNQRNTRSPISGKRIV